MSPEERELLKRSVQLGEENNEILRSIRRSMRFARIMSIIYWVIIIGSAVGAYYLIQPYLEFMSGVYGDTKSSFGDLSNIFEQFKNLSQ